MPYTPPPCIVDAWKTVREFSNYYNGSERPSDLSTPTIRYLGHVYHICGTLCALDDFKPKEYGEAVNHLFTMMERQSSEVIKPQSPDSDCPFAREVVRRANQCLVNCTEAFLKAMDDDGQETSASRLRLEAMKRKLGTSLGVSCPPLP